MFLPFYMFFVNSLFRLCFGTLAYRFVGVEIFVMGSYPFLRIICTLVLFSYIGMCGLQPVWHNLLSVVF